MRQFRHANTQKKVFDGGWGHAMPLRRDDDEAVALGQLRTQGLQWLPLWSVIPDVLIPEWERGGTQVADPCVSAKLGL